MSSIKTTQIDGDVSVGRNVAVGGGVTVQGSSQFKGSVKVEGWLEAENIKHANKGMFENIENLEQSYPLPHNGWWAIVGTTLPGGLYIAYDKKWKYIGEYSGELSIDSEVFETRLTELQENYEVLSLQDEVLSSGIASLENSLDDAVMNIQSSLSEFVHLRDEQTITGVKIFGTSPIFSPVDGDAPFAVTSRSRVENLNADMLDGWHASDFAKLGLNASFGDLSVTGELLVGSPVRLLSSFNSNSVTSMQGLDAFRVGTEHDASAGWGTYIWSYGNGRGFIQQASGQSGKAFSLSLNPLGGNVGVNIGNSDNAQYPLDVAGDIRARGVLRGYGMRTSNICFECDSDGTFGAHGNEINTTSGRMWLQYDNPGNLGLCYGGGNTTVYGNMIARKSLGVIGVATFGGGIECEGEARMGDVSILGDTTVLGTTSLSMLEVGYYAQFNGDVIVNGSLTSESVITNTMETMGGVNVGSSLRVGSDVILSYNVDTEAFGRVLMQLPDGSGKIPLLSLADDAISIGDNSGSFLALNLNAGSGFLNVHASDTTFLGSVNVNGSLRVGEATLSYDPVTDTVTCNKKIVFNQ